jgi:hypothetical protein
MLLTMLQVRYSCGDGAKDLIVSIKVFAISHSVLAIAQGHLCTLVLCRPCETKLHPTCRSPQHATMS